MEPVGGFALDRVPRRRRAPVTTLGVLLLLGTLVPQAPGDDSLLALARRLPDAALAVEAQARPLAVRDAIAEAMAASVRTPSEEERELTAARRLAQAYAAAWSDSFLVHLVARFTAWPRVRRVQKVWEDSVRRAGVAAYGRDGPRAAIAIWRRALVRATAVADTAGVAAVLGNIGAGYLAEGRADSAEGHLLRALALARRVGDVRVEANALTMLAGLSSQRGQLATARERYGKAVALSERIGDSRGLAADHNNLGLLAQDVGDTAEARRQFETALELNRHDGRAENAATNLVNLAGLASTSGDFAQAETQYRDALATWREREQWAELASALRGLGLLELRRGDYPAARANLQDALAIYRRTGPLPDALAVWRDLAGAVAGEGDLQGALDALREALQVADSAGAPADVRAGIMLMRADVAVQLNTYAEAQRLYAGAEALYERAGMRAGAAEAQAGHGILELEGGDTANARALLSEALRAQVLAGNRRSAALTRLSLARVALAEADTAAARAQLARAVGDVERAADPVATAAALGERGGLEAAAGAPALAESLYRAALARLGDRIAPEVAWRLHDGLAGALGRRRNPEAVARELRLALAEIERSSRSLALAERRSEFLTDKWGVYTELVLLEQGRRRPGAAFEASERLRAREMLEVLSRGRIETAPDAPTELVAREQDLRRRIGELTRAVEGAEARVADVRGPDVSRASSAARQVLARTQDAYAELLLEIKERAPRHAALVSGGVASWRDVARRLGPQEAFLEYLVSDSASLVFVVTRDSFAAVNLGVGRRELARLVEFARGTLEARDALQPDSLWRSALYRLHRFLIAPVEDAGLLAGKTRLIVVPHAELHYLPFAALLGGDSAGRFLVERYELEETPSASVWLALGDRQAAGHGVGVIAFAPRPDVLRASGDEVGTVARLEGAEAKVLTGPAASEDAFRREAPSGRVIHLATLGVLNKQNPLFSFVQLAPGGSGDGRLEVHEVFGLDLKADLVVLSACQTGLASGALADVPAGDDWVGLTQAFLTAGARRVVASLWPVGDMATAALMERFYQGFTAGVDPVRALAQAQRALIGAPATAHPFNWAGFVVAGGAP